MMSAKVFVLTVTMVLALGGVAAAQKVNPTVDLSGSGQTVGGPGGVSNSTGGQAVFFDSSMDPRKVCVTISNFGAPVNLQIDAATVGVVATLQTLTVCKNDVDTAGGTCDAGASCKYVWRVDGKF